MTFYADEIEACPAYGWQGGPNIDVLIKTLQNRHERRNWESGIVLHTYTLPFANVRDDRYLSYIKSAYLALGGPLHTFLCKDHGDFRHSQNNRRNGTAMVFGVGDGAETDFQLSKTYTFGTHGAAYRRDITKPLNTIRVYVDGVQAAVTINTLTGIISFSVAPALGAVLTWTGEFRVPVRFSDFYLPSTIDTASPSDDEEGKAVNGSCTLTEVPGE